MLMSNLLGKTLRDKPAEASLVSHVFLLRGGYIRNVGSGIYSLLLPGLKVQRKIEEIIREEMNKVGGQEMLLPVVLPAELWKESGRFSSVGRELLRFKDRGDRDMVLAMTHEEAVVHLARSEAKSYTDYPFMLYQIQTKFRDEPRARGGLIRTREFTMKDAYSFHTSQEDLEQYYEKVKAAYGRIFRRVGLEDVVPICSDVGMMGGKVAHEFMFLSDDGEDSIVFCNNCDYKANMEVALSKIEKKVSLEQPIEEVHTPNICSIEEIAEFFNVEKSAIIKAVVYKAEQLDRPVIVFLKGDLQVNEAKLRNILQSEIHELTNLSDYNLAKGFIGPDDNFEVSFKVIYDISLEDDHNSICGANRENYHKKGFSITRDVTVSKFYDVSKVETNHKCVHCGGTLSVKRGIEVGNIFQLGNKYTKAMNMTYANKDGELAVPIMGCYGIGIGRLLACIIEANHDNFGPIWPKNIAPWQIEICALNLSQNDVKIESYNLYEDLSKEYDVLFDDRNLAAGVQFSDSDLLGIPVRIIVSKRNLNENKFEIKFRGKQKSIKMAYSELKKFLSEYS